MNGPQKGDAKWKKPVAEVPCGMIPLYEGFRAGKSVGQTAEWGCQQGGGAFADWYRVFFGGGG